MSEPDLQGPNAKAPARSRRRPTRWRVVVAGVALLVLAALLVAYLPHVSLFVLVN
jgi:uncharacterized membrane protein HdeD (DUF308 family)